MYWRRSRVKPSALDLRWFQPSYKLPPIILLLFIFKFPYIVNDIMLMITCNEMASHNDLENLKIVLRDLALIPPKAP